MSLGLKGLMSNGDATLKPCSSDNKYSFDVQYPWLNLQCIR